MSSLKSTPTDNGPGSNPQSVRTSVLQSSIASSPAAAECRWCKFFRFKSRLPSEGDWLFASGNTCSQHQDTAHGFRDLDDDFASYEQSVLAFQGVVEAEGRRLLYDHAKESLAATEQKLNTTRDKAKQLLASASFTLALISVSMVLLKDSRATGPGWALLLILFMFFWVVSHFLRSLRLAIRAITRDEVVLVSTQNVAKTLSTGKQDFENGRVYLQLAAEIRTAATATNVNVRQRINNVILAQTAFRWGLTLLPVLVVFYVGAILLFSTAESGRSSQESGRSRIEKAEPVELETAIKRLGDGLHKKLDHVDNRVKSIEDKVDSIKAAVERLSSAKEKSRNSPGM